MMSGLVNGITGFILQKTGSYVMVFVYFSGTYVLALLILQLMVPTIGMTKRSIGFEVLPVTVPGENETSAV
jgi:hypothetical protein